MGVTVKLMCNEEMLYLSDRQEQKPKRTTGSRSNVWADKVGCGTTGTMGQREKGKKGEKEKENKAEGEKGRRGKREASAAAEGGYEGKERECMQGDKENKYTIMKSKNSK